MALKEQMHYTKSRFNDHLKINLALRSTIQIVSLRPGIGLSVPAPAIPVFGLEFERLKNHHVNLVPAKIGSPGTIGIYGYSTLAYRFAFSFILLLVSLFT